ncbi:DNA mismatch endonuclease Vsr [bacterium]|nr:DNA mismatch endonuclease Vsr [bacterium]
MPDVFIVQKRSEVMPRIRGCGNKDTEVALANLLRANRLFGWRRHPPIFGKPDFVFRKQRIAIFVDGCFWHCCPKHSNLPANNRVFWQKKLAANVARDRRVNRELRTLGWRVIRIWEHDLKKPARALARIRKALSS